MSACNRCVRKITLSCEQPFTLVIGEVAHMEPVALLEAVAGNRSEKGRAGRSTVKARIASNLFCKCSAK